MHFDTIIVGGGIAGLTAAAFLSKSGRRVLLCEKEDHLGGLIGSFDFKGFTFDAGIRAMENSGVLFPMLRQLGLDIDFDRSLVSIGIGNDVIDLTSQDSIKAYREMLNNQFPGEEKAIAALVEVMKRIMDYMRVIYGIDNPLFMDLKTDRAYLMKTLLPWMFKYITTVGKIKQFNVPVEEYLKSITANQALTDVIAQHFFKSTPAFFALSYFSLYLDYNYPRGGTGTLISKMAGYIEKNGGMIKTSTAVSAVDPEKRTVTDEKGEVYPYGKLIWCADQKALYASLVHIDRLPAPVSGKIRDRLVFLSDKTGGDSVATLYLTVDIDKTYFAGISGPHFFYTPLRKGLGALPAGRIQSPDGSYIKDHDRVFEWLRAYLQLTTYEISIPVLRDGSLAPEGKTGLIISTLMDYALAVHIRAQGWYDEFKTLCQEAIIASLTGSVYPRLSGHVIDGFVSTPLTIQRLTGNTGGAITGWAFTNAAMPAITKMPQITRSVKTPIPHIFQAGQWTYSPSGFPISILTGKLAADRAMKELKG